ncbi:MAG: hypothetical protein ACN6OP_08380, partial [Pseudomonadales bacterium]
IRKRHGVSAECSMRGYVRQAGVTDRVSQPCWSGSLPPWREPANSLEKTARQLGCAPLFHRVALQWRGALAD